MKIGIDGSCLARNFPSGIQNYTVNLLSSLAKIDKKNEYFIFSTKNRYIPKQENFTFVNLTNAPILKKQLLLPYLVSKYKIDTFHFVEPYGSIFLTSPRIVTTVPDVDLDRVYPKSLELKYFLKRYYSSFLRYYTIRNSDSLIAISKTTKADLDLYLRKNGFRKKINVVYLSGWDSDYKRANFGKKDYFLCMGDFSPRKNVKFIFEVFGKMPLNFKNKYKLKTVVSTKYEADRYKKFAEFIGISRFLRVVVSPTSAELKNLYAHAKAFLYPSLYEGFGLPILEAMSCGCPVITSNTGSMKEVAGSAALLIDPRSESDLTRALIDIDKKPQRSKELISKGYERIKVFSWEKTAKQTLSLYLDKNK